MAKFCGKCGAKLDETTGLCPNCDADKLNKKTEPPEADEEPKPKQDTASEPKKPLSKKEAKKQRKADKKAAKKAKKKEKRTQQSTGKKVRRFFLKLIAVLLVFAILSASVAGALVYFDIVDIPVVATVLDKTGIKKETSPFVGQSINESYVPNEDHIVYENENQTCGYVNNMVLLFAYSNVSEEHISKIAEELGGKIVGKILGLHQYQVQVAPMSKEELEAICKKAMEYEEVKYAIVDIVVTMENEDIYTPNDPWKDTFQGLWGVDWDEDKPSGYNWWIEATKVLSAWQNRDSFSLIDVGVVDNGFDATHEDLNIICLNSTVNNAEHHGTHVAGVIGATNDNQIGISGILNQVNLYGVDCYATSKQKKNNINVSSLLAGIELCINNGCKVVNMSSAVSYTNTEETKANAEATARNAIIYLICMLDSREGVNDFIVVQAAGNGDKNNNGVDAQKYAGYFASITEDLVKEVFNDFAENNIQLEHDISVQDVLDSYMVVGAVDKKQKNGTWQLANFSNYGDTITVCAPGVDVFSTTVMGGLNGNYANDSGTSMAAPIVAGITAMVWSANPDMSAGTVKDIIQNTADITAISRKKADSGTYYMINASAAVEAALNYIPESPNDNQFGQFDQYNIPSGAVEYNGHYYYVYDVGTITDWNMAQEYCEAQGGYLATITSAEEDAFLYSYITGAGYSSVVFGLTDQEQADDWHWVTGEKFSYQNWRSGEPNHQGGYEHYGMYYERNTDGTWNDGSGRGGPFLCEWGEYQTSSNSHPQEPVRTTSDERDIVLVLDTSGSMSGTPMTETKKAATNFVNTILDEDASIGIVTYDDSSYMLSDFSVNKSSLTNAVSNIYDGGGTNIEAGLAEARSMLNTSGAKKKIIVLMSDGEPNRGKEGDALISYADEIKDDGIIIYTLGFFESLGSYKSSAQILMEGIASDGCHYEVASADDLVFFFEDMADQINGQKYIYIRIACPVDVTVTHNGETLCSAEDDLNLRTDFGTLTFEGNNNMTDANEDDRIKVLRLKEGADYDVQIVGTGHGIMDYTIGFMDENGDYSA